MNKNDKSLLIDRLLELMRASRLNKNQKIKIMNLIDKQEGATENQKERFCLYYGLNTNDRKNMSITNIANLYDCTYSAIKFSISAMERKMVNRISEQDIVIIKTIIDECKKMMNNWLQIKFIYKIQ